MTDDDREDGLHWDREDSEPETFNEDEGGDPAAAFEALRAKIEDLSADLRREMTTIRKGVESAFDQFERQGAPVDYSAELGSMAQQLATVGERLEAVEKSPVLRQGAEHYARVLERGGEGMVRTAVQQLERQASNLERAGNVLASHTQNVLHRKDQNFRMWMAAGIGVVAGAFLLVLLPRFMWFSIDSRVAALVMGGDRIKAASAMMNSVDPAIVKKMNWGAQFYDASGGEITACLEKARQAGKDQKCTITVPAPEN